MFIYFHQIHTDTQTFKGMLCWQYYTSNCNVANNTISLLLLFPPYSPLRPRSQWWIWRKQGCIRVEKHEGLQPVFKVKILQSAAPLALAAVNRSQWGGSWGQDWATFCVSREHKLLKLWNYPNTGPYFLCNGRGVKTSSTDILLYCALVLAASCGFRAVELVIAWWGLSSLCFYITYREQVGMCRSKHSDVYTCIPQRHVDFHKSI